MKERPIIFGPDSAYADFLAGKAVAAPLRGLADGPGVVGRAATVEGDRGRGERQPPTAPEPGRPAKEGPLPETDCSTQRSRGASLPDEPPPFFYRLPPGTTPCLLPGHIVHIYALVDPFTHEVRYIGKSRCPERRLASHCNDRSSTYRTNWIRQVLARGHRPRLMILDSFPEWMDWQGAERAWIAWGLLRGWNLTNCTSGGDGVPDLPAEIRARISATWKGRKHRPESLAKIGAASRTRRHTPEWREYMRQAMAGRTFTSEWIDKIRRGVSKLTDEQVRTIRQRLRQGAKVVDLAAEYGVHRTTITNVRMGHYYGHVRSEASA